ncbi:hypothetical protein [Jannaschia formosa]|uniref:hypothetical protein n=1 Tax=Jannaschia formosa TaxID=2259592 RepID=UPI000E1C1805|nr:hypothetical protein [Jannaschia formosa]TFL19911.1 hypothetical protein DR046_00760 [Jannaschia formosa]
MNDFFRSLASFLKGTAGAVTVDYVVLTAAATGVAVASSDVVRDGLRALAATVNSESTGEEIDDPANVGRVYRESFANGAPGWEGGDTIEIDGRMSLGPIGGGEGGESMRREFLLEDGLPYTTIDFNMFAMDSLDDESGYIYLGGQIVGEVRKNADETVFIDYDIPGVEITGTIVQDREAIGGQSGADRWWRDSEIAVSIKYNRPDPHLTLGFGSNADQASHDEFFAVQDIVVTGLHDPDAE